MAKGIIKGLGRRTQVVNGKKVELEKVPSPSGFGYTWEKPKRGPARVQGPQQ